MPRSSLLDLYRLQDASPCYSPHPFHVMVSRKGEHGSRQKPNGSALGPTTSATWTLPTHLSSPSTDTGHWQSHSLSIPKGHTARVPCGTGARNNSPKRPPNDSGATVNAKQEDKLITAKHKGTHGTIKEAQTTIGPALQLHFALFPPDSSPCVLFCLSPCGTSLRIPQERAQPSSDRELLDETWHLLYQLHLLLSTIRLLRKHSGSSVISDGCQLFPIFTPHPQLPRTCPQETAACRVC